MNDETNVPQDNDMTADQSEPREATHYESRKYRKRAQAAEHALHETKRELESSLARLAELEETVSALERRARVDQLLAEAEAIDLESARLLTEIAISEMEEPDVDAAVAELKRRKPALFRTKPRMTAAQSPLPVHGAEAGARTAAIATAAEAAQTTGSRTDLLRYLRLKRTR
ncbi:MAG TPA: hypothetical protein PK400_04730 [Phycisphaerales bacterium]|nr:hypothetical protein [Phycisphaerales bacterium]HRQ75316.1 hypothetical protein [Phycisphaerales bacterium]